MSLDDAEARRAWSRAHGDLDPDASVWVSGWLTLVHRVARPLVRRHVSPDAVTLAGVAVSVLVPVVTAAGAGWPALAGILAVVVGVLDGVDGAVARMSGSTTRWGRVVDPLADRVSDLLLLSVPFLLGAPAALWVAAVVLTLLLEATRSSAAAAGAGDVVVVTPWERAGRVVWSATVGLLLGAAWALEQLAVVPAGPAAAVAMVGAAVAVALAAGSLLQLVVVARRRLVALDRSGGSDEAGDDPRGEGHERQSAPGVARPADEEEPRDR